MKFNKLLSAIVFSALLGGCLKDSKDATSENSMPLFVVTCDSVEEGKLTGCWMSKKCEEYDPSVHASSSSGNFLKESFSISKENYTISSVIEFYSDVNCENAVAKTELIYHGHVLYGDDFTNSNGLVVTEYKVQSGESEKVSYFYQNGSEMCFPENSFIVHMLTRANDQSFNELDRSVDFDNFFDNVPEI